MAIVEVKTSTFESEVLKSDKPVIVDFWANWCGPCRMLLPIMDEVAAEATDIKICKINVDEEPDLASKFKVMTIPTLIVFKGGEEVKRSVGVISKEEVINLAK